MRLSRALSWAPLLIAFVYGALLLAFFPRLIRALYWNSDTAAPLVIAQRLDAGAALDPTYVTQPIYVTLNLATRSLPGHRTIWLLIPFGMALAAVAAVVWSVRTVAGAWAAALAGTLTFAVAPPVLGTYLTQTHHGSTWLGTALAGAFVVFAVQYGERTGLAAAVATMVAVVLGLGTGSDLLLVVTGVAPLLFVGMVFPASRHGARRAGILVAATAAGALGLGAAALTGFAAVGYVVTTPRDNPFQLATVQTVLENLGLLLQGLLLMTNGLLLDARVGRVPALVALGLAVPITLLFLAIAAACVRSLASHRAWESPRSRGLFGLVAFWVVSGSLVAASFVLSEVPADVAGTRYLVPLLFFLAVVVPIGTHRPRQALLGSLVSVLVVASVMNLVSVANLDTFRQERTTHVEGLVREIRAVSLGRGYADYWYANSISWKTRDEVQVLPVRQALGGSGVGELCPHLQNVSRSAFAPRRSRSFVVADDLGFVRLRPPEPRYGVPSNVIRVGRFTVFVYEYDVAERFCERYLRESAGRTGWS